MPKIRTAFRTISNRKVIAKLLYLLDSYRRTTPSPGYHDPQICFSPMGIFRLQRQHVQFLGMKPKCARRI